jgi:hypothetical protein
MWQHMENSLEGRTFGYTYQPLEQDEGLRQFGVDSCKTLKMRKIIHVSHSLKHELCHLCQLKIFMEGMSENPKCINCLPNVNQKI